MHSVSVESKIIEDNPTAVDVAGRLIGRFKDPQLTGTVAVRLDGLKTEITDFVTVTSTKDFLAGHVFEILETKKNLTGDQSVSFEAISAQVTQGKFGFVWDVNGEGLGHSGNGALEYTAADFDADLNGARDFCWTCNDAGFVDDPTNTIPGYEVF